mmetsp:Transcript_10139/g.10220  ORF Transcript_10139/g.10220 Transcript_10139/m.10220 type:complete len:194 (-) Transcript_10139:37-618(-)
MKDTMTALRQENIELGERERNLSQMLTLSEEQTNTLKQTIRDLEASLYREKEFNSDTSRLNAEYLVNILKKFLMSTDMNERANLVPVLCSILHFSNEESKIISNKWSVAKKGLVGWFAGGGGNNNNNNNSTTNNSVSSSSSGTNNNGSGYDNERERERENEFNDKNNEKEREKEVERSDISAYKDGVGGLDIY